MRFPFTTEVKYKFMIGEKVILKKNRYLDFWGIGEVMYMDRELFRNAYYVHFPNLRKFGYIKTILKLHEKSLERVIPASSLEDLSVKEPDG